MANSLYMNRVIVASGEFNQVTRQWKSIVCIFWKTDTQKLHPINDLPGIFGTESEAIAFALKAGKGLGRYSTRHEGFAKKQRPLRSAI